MGSAAGTTDAWVAAGAEEEYRIGFVCETSRAAMWDARPIGEGIAVKRS